MYELTCPSCHHVTPSSFVRLGAVIDCAKCNHRYEIGAAHVKRKVVKLAPLPAGATDPFKTSGGTSGDRPRLDKEGNVIGLSGLSEAMQREAGPQVDGKPGKPGQFPPEQRRRGRHRKQAMLLLAGTLVMAVVFIGVAAWIGSNNDDADAAAAAAASTEIPAELLPLEAKRLEPAPWERLNRPPELRHLSNYIAYTKNEGIVAGTDGQQFVTAQVVGPTGPLIVEGTIDLSLVSQPYVIERARTSVPVALVHRQLERQMLVPLPEELHETTLTARTLVEAGETIADPIIFERVDLHAYDAGGAQQGVQFATTNTASRAVEKPVFLVTAADAEGRPLAQWLARSEATLAPGERLGFEVSTPLADEVVVDHWRVEGAGAAAAVPDEDD